MKKTTLLMVGLISLNLSAAADTLTFPEGDVHSSSSLGKVIVTHSNEGYSIMKDGVSHSVHSYNVDASIRDLDNDQLSKALGHIYVTVTGDESEPVIHSSVRGLGGGPLLAVWGGMMTAPYAALVGTAVAGPVGAAVGWGIGAVGGAIAGLVSPSL